MAGHGVSKMLTEWLNQKSSQYIHKYGGVTIRTWKSFVFITMLNKLTDIFILTEQI